MNHKISLKQWMKNITSNLADILKQGKLSGKSVGYIIRSLHMNAPFHLIFYMLYGSYFYTNVVFIMVVMLVISFYTFDMCILSALEQKLCEDTFVIIDPILELCDLQINTANRYYISNIIGIPFVLIILLLWWFKK